MATEEELAALPLHQRVKEMRLMKGLSKRAAAGLLAEELSITRDSALSSLHRWERPPTEEAPGGSGMNERSAHALATIYDQPVRLLLPPKPVSRLEALVEELVRKMDQVLDRLDDPPTQQADG